LSDLNERKHKQQFNDAVTWALPQIKAAASSPKVTAERKTDIDDVKQFESRIKKQIEAIKHEQDHPTYLTVKQIEDIQKLAHDEAYEAAYKDAYEKGTKDSEDFLETQLRDERARLNQNAAQLQQCINTLSQPLKDLDTEIEQQLTDTVFHFCKQILLHELTNDPAHITHLIQQSVLRLPVAQRKTTIKLNPDDINLLKESDIDVADQDWKVEPDESVAAGGCIIESKSSSMDMSIEKRLQAVTRQLYSGLELPDEDNINLSATADDEPAEADSEAETDND